MPSQEPVNPRQIKPESCREPETSSPFQQRNVNLQPSRKSVEGNIHVSLSHHKGGDDFGFCVQSNEGPDIPAPGIALCRRHVFVLLADDPPYFVNLYLAAVQVAEFLVLNLGARLT